MTSVGQIDGELTVLLTLALQLAGLIPSLFVAILVLVLVRHAKSALVPVLYFLVLAASFAGPLQALIGVGPSMTLPLALVESLQPAVCFLMVVQCLYRKPPPPVYWLVMALPLLGGSSLLYLSFVQQNICLGRGYCVDASAAHLLYHMLGSCVVFLLLMTQIHKLHGMPQMDSLIRRHSYWLMLALVGLNLCLFAVDLAMLAEQVKASQHLMIASVLRISFIYLVITSLFRVLDAPRPIVSAPGKERPVPPELIAQIEALMKDERIYREMGFSREALASRLGVGEHVISRAVNQHFGKNFNEYVNGFRIEEAKERLTRETIAVTIIAFEVGFSSIASFNRVFKQVVGMSPTEYRAKPH